MWECGTDLVRQIFEQNDEESWAGIKSEIELAVARWVPNCALNDIRVVQDEGDGNAVHVRIDYSVKQGRITKKDSFVVTL